MKFGTPLSYFLVATMFATQLTMLTLQVTAHRRHHHRSFLLLSVATVSGLLYLGLPWTFAGSLALRATPAAARVYDLTAAALLLTQMVLGVWGTASLFRSYASLSTIPAQAPLSPADAPNYGLERP